MPLIKKPDLDSTDPRSYRLISNLSVVSKLLERVVFRQLYNYLSAADLLPRLQSAYRTHHSTETAVLEVLTDILYAVDDGDLSVLALLDLSAAFDTVDYDILLTRLKGLLRYRWSCVGLVTVLPDEQGRVCATWFGSVDT